MHPLKPPVSATGCTMIERWEGIYEKKASRGGIYPFLKISLKNHLLQYSFSIALVLQHNAADDILPKFAITNE